MEQKQIILKKSNAHRAAVIRNIEHPETGTKRFYYMNRKLDNGRYASTFTDGDLSIILYENEYRLWEIIETMYPVTLEEYDELANRAFDLTSFDPEKRAAETVNMAEIELNEDIKDMPGQEKTRYIESYKKHFSAWLSVHSQCASAAVTGPAKFPVSKMKRNNEREHAAFEAFRQFRDRALDVIAKNIEKAKPQEQKDEEEWQMIENNIRSTAKTITEINDGAHYGSKPLFISNLYGRIETVAKRGNLKLVERAVALVRELNKQSSIITERHKFFKLPEVAKVAQKKASAMAEEENKDIPFDGGMIRFNYAEDRLQILFDKKPERDTIDKLKHSGFHWSPRFGAWQRQLTDNAVYAANKILNIKNII